MPTQEGRLRADGGRLEDGNGDYARRRDVMGQSFSLGRISGIRIGVNWSVLLIVALLAYGLAAGQFPAEVPRRPEAEYVVAAIITAVAYI